jgi:ABC-type taurine transport system, periplasmic component
MMKFDKWVKLAGFTFVVGAVLAPMAPVSAASKPDVIIGYENAGADPYLMSMGGKLFEKHMPANIEYKMFSSGPASMSALASNSLNFMCGIGIPPLVTAIAQGLPMTIVYNQNDYTHGGGRYVVKPTAASRTSPVWQGTRSRSSPARKHRSSSPPFWPKPRCPMDAVTQINMAPPQMRTSWVTGNIDAAIVWDPVFSALREAGGKVIKTDADLPRTASSYNVCIANAKWAAAHPDLVRGFVAALDEGYQATVKDPEKSLQVMAKEGGVTVPMARSLLAGYELFSGKDQTSANVMGSGKGVESSATYQTLVNTAKVLQQIGRIQSPISDFHANVAPQYAEFLSH